MPNLHVSSITVSFFGPKSKPIVKAHFAGLKSAFFNLRWSRSLAAKSVRPARHPPPPQKKKKNRWRHRTTGDSNLGSNAATVTIYLIVLFFKFLSPLLISTTTLTFFGLNYTFGSEVGIFI